MIITPNKIAERIAKKVAENVNEFANKEDHIRYGLEWILSGILQISFVLVISLFLNIFFETLICVLFVSTFRTISGGAHFSGFYRCMFVGAVIILTIIYMSFYLETWANLLTYFYFVSFPIVLFVVYKYAPSLFEKKNVLTAEQKKRLHVLSLVITVCIFVAIHYLGQIGITLWLGILYQSFTLVPIGINVIHWLDHKLEKMTYLLERGNGNVT